VLEVHLRFLANCLRGLAGEPLHELWAIACGLGGQDRDIGWMRQALDTVLQGESAQTMNVLVAALEHGIGDEIDAGRTNYISEAPAVLERADLLFLHELKLALCEGMRVFETYQHDVAPCGGALLLEICRRLPQLYAAFFTRTTTHSYESLV